MTRNTVNGAKERIFKIKKIKLVVERKEPMENIVHLLSSAKVTWK